MARNLQTYEYYCKFCNVKCIRSNRSGLKPKFCGPSCSNRWHFANGRISSFRKNDNQKAASTCIIVCEWCGLQKEKRARNPLPRFCNQQCCQRWNGKNRKKYVWTEKHRKSQSLRLKERLMDSPEKQYSYAFRGWYAGHFFRSSYEYSFLKMMNEKGHLSSIESESFSVPYTAADGSSHFYYPDFFIKDLNLVVEIKPLFKLSDESVKIKTAAAQKFFADRGITFETWTERELNLSKRLSRKDIESDPLVFLVSKYEENDRLDACFRQQLSFMRILQEKRNFREFPLDLSKKDDQRFLKEISHECMHELFEAVHLLKNSKGHRQTDVPGFEKDLFLEEISDALHYMIEIAILLGLSSKDLYSAFMKKGTINAARIMTGY